MKTAFVHLVSVLSFLLCAGAAQEELTQGLIVTEYPRHAAQAGGDNNFFIPIDQLGEPVGVHYLAASLSPWTWETERNAVAAGYLKIDADGDYSFTTRSFYDRNLLLIDGKEVCKFRDGDETVVTVPLKKGNVSILSAGFVGGRGHAGIHVRWKPPGQRELSPIPAPRLLHVDDGTVKPKKTARLPAPGKGSKFFATSVVTASNDFVVEAWKNGHLIATGQREMVEELFGATAERMKIEVRPGDWLVFHVVHNRLRWQGARYFAVAGCFENNRFGFVSDPSSEAWSVCDDPSLVREFIRQRDAGTEVRAGAIANLWRDGDALMRRHAGAEFPGKPLTGGAASTWIKFVASKSPPQTGAGSRVPGD